jgi:hypothetical protein
MEAILKARTATANHEMSMSQSADKHVLNMVTSAQAHKQNMAQKASKPTKGKETK